MTPQIGGGGGGLNEIRMIMHVIVLLYICIENHWCTRTYVCTPMNFNTIQSRHCRLGVAAFRQPFKREQWRYQFVSVSTCRYVFKQRTRYFISLLILAPKRRYQRVTNWICNVDYGI